MHIQRAVVESFVLSTLFAALASAGDLNPPAGPVSPTMKTLEQVEPRTPLNQDTAPGDLDSLFRIRTPGSYYMTADAVAGAGRHGIEIATNGTVSIDMRGFTLTGGAGSLDGVVVEAGSFPTMVTLTNGFILDFDGDGVDLNFRRPRIKDVLVSSCGGWGFITAGAAILDRCTSRLNTAGGFNTSGHTLATNCVAEANVGVGFVGLGVWRDCLAEDNNGGGFSGNGVYEGCSAFGNTGPGFFVNGDSALSGCEARSNGGDGFTLANEMNTLVGCVSNDNAGDGFGATNLGSGALTNCLAQQNDQAGFLLSSGAMLTGCTARSNDGEGIRVGSASRIVDCNSSDNGNDGIRLFDDSFASGNNCEGNGRLVAAAGISASGVRNRIDENNVVDNPIGVEVSGSRNVIIRNTASLNTTNYAIGAGNADAQTVIVGAGFIVTNAWANLSY